VDESKLHINFRHHFTAISLYMTDANNSEIDPEILKTWQLRPVIELKGGFQNQHWLVETMTGRALVLRRYKEKHLPDLDYEFAVMRHLCELGWPVPELVAAPLEHGGRTWCLFTLLPGDKTSATGSGEERRRGRLLAELHQTLKGLTDPGQRRHFLLPNALACDPSLFEAIKRVETVQPEEGYVLRWHLERAAERLATLDIEGAEKLVLHGDFVARNLLFADGGELSGILDFEITHLNVRVADFAMSWRGCYDEVIHGYEEVHPLDELDRHLLVPTFWSWLFMGIKDLLESMSDEQLQQVDFSWHIKQLSRRSALFGDMGLPCPKRPQNQTGI
jgi:aminoglycoside phosphotransferase (APT) family kinase protein